MTFLRGFPALVLMLFFYPGLSYGNVVGDVDYVRPWKSISNSEYPLDDTFNCKREEYVTGKFIAGPYKGYELILCKDKCEWECKGAGCDRLSLDRSRFARKGKKVVLLSRVSEYSSGVRGEAPYIRDIMKVRAIVEVDTEYTIPELEYHRDIFGPAPGQSLIYVGENEGSPDNRLVEIYSIGSPKVFMTNPEINEIVSFYGEEGPKEAEDCTGSDCYRTNAFFVFRPDGTYLMYRYKPAIVFGERTGYGYGSGRLELTMKNGTTLSIDSRYMTRGYCSDEEYVDFGSIIARKDIKDGDLIPVGQARIISGTGWFESSTVYKVSGSHRINIEFHEKHTRWWAKSSEYVHGMAKSPLEYGEFLRKYPVLIWKDPFGRYMRFNRSDLIPPSLCEPVIYVYSPREQDVAIKVKGLGTMTASSPNYGDGWLIKTRTDGVIVEKKTGRTFKSLFWEGASIYIPERNEGYVVARADVPSFLNCILFDVGLRGSEIADFIQTWSGRLQEAPYCFVTFHGRATIDATSTLDVIPHPDSVIRVLMDYRLLQTPISVKPPALDVPAARKGLTLVEWGGIRRH